MLRFMSLLLASVLCVTGSLAAAKVREVRVVDARSSTDDKGISELTYTLEVTFDGEPDDTDKATVAPLFKWAGSLPAADARKSSNLFVSESKIAASEKKMTQRFRAVSGNVAPLAVTKISFVEATGSSWTYKLEQSSTAPAREIDRVLDLLETIVKKERGVKRVKTLRDRGEDGSFEVYIRAVSDK